MGRVVARSGFFLILIISLSIAAFACRNRSGKNHPPPGWGWDTGSGPGTGTGPNFGTGSGTGPHTGGIPRTVLVEYFDRFPSFYPNLADIIRVKKDFDVLYANFQVHPPSIVFNTEEHKFIVLGLYGQPWPDYPYVHIDGERVGNPAPCSWDIESKIKERKEIPAQVSPDLVFEVDNSSRTVTITGSVTNMSSETFGPICLRAAIHDLRKGTDWLETSYDCIGREIANINIDGLAIGETKEFPAWTSRSLPGDVNLDWVGVMASVWELTSSGLGRCLQATEAFPAGPAYEPPDGNPSDPINFEDYFWPLSTDWRWTFAGGAYKDIGPVTQMGSVQTFPMREYSSEDPGWTQYFGTDGSHTLYELRFAIYPKFYWDFDPPFVWGFRDMPPGEKFTTRSTAIKHDHQTGKPIGNPESWKFEATYLGKEEVDVPYGKCVDCIKMHYRTFRQNMLLFDEVFWFSRHEGIVKYQAMYVNADRRDILWETSTIQFPGH
ncbi:MAG: hypothetical protein E3J72_21910 [Planctomycetota bacterium]|nr:MAG: hypothetical protein E3J72_21910 [Planctomycetota bacterium]